MDKLVHRDSFTTKDGKEIKIAQVKYVSLNQIQIKPENREHKKKNVLKMIEKITKMQFIDTLKVFPENSKGIYEVAEGNRRMESLMSLCRDEDKDLPIWPVSILPKSHYDADDIDNVIQTLSDFNKDNIGWNMYDYVSRWAKTSRKVYQNMIKDMNKFVGQQELLTNVLVCSIYTGQKSNYVKVKDGSFTGRDEQYTNLIKEYVVDWVSTYGSGKKAGFFPTYNQNTIVWLWSLIDEMKTYDFGSENNRYDYVTGLLEYMTEWYDMELNSRYQQSLLLPKKAVMPGQHPLPTDHKDAVEYNDEIYQLYSSKEHNFRKLPKLK